MGIHEPYLRRHKGGLNQYTCTDAADAAYMSACLAGFTSIANGHLDGLARFISAMRDREGLDVEVVGFSLSEGRGE